jgi:cbb3-type cytochrome oxidase subunit 1
MVEPRIMGTCGNTWKFLIFFNVSPSFAVLQAVETRGDQEEVGWRLNLCEVMVVYVGLQLIKQAGPMSREHVYVSFLWYRALLVRTRVRHVSLNLPQGSTRGHRASPELCPAERRR